MKGTQDTATPLQPLQPFDQANVQKNRVSYPHAYTTNAIANNGTRTNATANNGTRTISESSPSQKEVPVGKKHGADAVVIRKMASISHELSNARKHLSGCRTIKTAMTVYHQHCKQLNNIEKALFTTDWQNKIREIAFPYFFELLQIKKVTLLGLQIAASKSDLDAFHKAFSQLIHKRILHPHVRNIKDSGLKLERTKEALQTVQLSMQGDLKAENVAGTENYKMAAAYNLGLSLVGKVNDPSLCCPFFVILEFRDLLKVLADEIGDKNTLNLVNPGELIEKYKGLNRESVYHKAVKTSSSDTTTTVIATVKPTKVVPPTPSKSGDICLTLNIPELCLNIDADTGLIYSELLPQLEKILFDEWLRKTLNYYVAAAETLMGNEQYPPYMINTTRLNIYPRVTLRLWDKQQYQQGMSSKELARIVANEIKDEVSSADVNNFLFKRYINRELQSDQQKIDKLEKRFKLQDMEKIQLIVDHVTGELTYS